MLLDDVLPTWDYDVVVADVVDAPPAVAWDAVLETNLAGDALIVLLGVSALASHDFSVRDTLIAIVVLSIFSYLVFVKGLELQFPLWPTFLSN